MSFAEGSVAAAASEADTALSTTAVDTEAATTGSLTALDSSS